MDYFSLQKIIEEKRQSLNKFHSINKKEVLLLSQELDLLIYDFYLKKIENKRSELDG